MSNIKNMHKENINFIHRHRNRHRIAELSGLHLNTVAAMLCNKRPNPTLDTMVALEKAVNLIKSAQK
tara:strand:+ start:412 stop:612 length:201 start_codon:yes stop_codon:yes gene_type:complete